MDKKRLIKSLQPEDLKGFEEFIEGQPADSNFLPRPAAKKEASFEHFTFLTNDTARLEKLKDLLMDKIPFSARHAQGQKLLDNQRLELERLRKAIFEVSNKPGSAYRKSLGEIFNQFFEPPKP